MKFIREKWIFLVFFIAFIMVPWIQIGKLHLLLFNFPHNRLEYFGYAIEIDTYGLIGIFTLVVLGLVLVSALSLSRFYCGKLCPNTFFAHLLTLFMGSKKSFFSKIVGFLFLTLLALIFSFSIIAYGIDTSELLEEIVYFGFAGWLVILLSLFMMAEIYMVQGWYCAYLCPYGGICAVLPLEDRLTYQFEDPNNSCIDCNGCVKSCPIPDLNIREGFDTRCIQCGLCEVACKKVFSKTNADSLISIPDRSYLSAAGREKGILIAMCIMIVLSISGVLFLSDTQHLDSCRLENSSLYLED